MAIEAGHCTASGAVECEGALLLEREMKPVELPERIEAAREDDLHRHEGRARHEAQLPRNRGEHGGFEVEVASGDAL
jgi:hypothetical protein